ncbi:MAG: penicillin-binding transpeptidase domain-containing protein, partial [Chthoniobacterales bacterium]
KDTIAWFACFAPYDNPKYTIVVMVQGGAHGGSVAAPIATRILQRTLAMDEGNFDPHLAWLPPADKPNPFQMIEAVNFKDSGPDVKNDDEENLDSSNASVQMSSSNAEPDVEPEADKRGTVIPRAQRANAKIAPAPTPPQKPNFFQRLFGARPAPQPAPTPQRGRPVPPRRPNQ